MQYFYRIFIFLLEYGMYLASFFNSKIKKGIIGRKNTFEILKKIDPKKKCIWMHASSLGEYEQGLPVLEKLKVEYPNDQIIISFFSPSGYEHINKKEHLADALIYLPFDTKSNAEKLLKRLNLRLFFSVKYDFWYVLYNKLASEKVPIFVVSCLFYPHQVYFTSFGNWFVKQLQNTVTQFFHQTEDSLRLAQSIGLKNGIYTGDTRFDRVKHLAENKKDIPYIKDFITNEKVIVFGSSWADEEEIANQIIASDWNGKIIIAPHDLKRATTFYQNHQKKAILYSEILNNTSTISEKSVVIIDSIGLLSQLYQYANVAVIGGGFSQQALHNILEAIAFGCLVVFGNRYKKNPEADAAIKEKVGFSFENPTMASTFILQNFTDHQWESFSENARIWIKNQPNASEKILNWMITK